MKLNTNHVLKYGCGRYRVQAVAKDQSRIFLKSPDRRRSTLDKWSVGSHRVVTEKHESQNCCRMKGSVTWKNY